MHSHTPTTWIRQPLATSDPAATAGVVVQGSRIVEKLGAGQVPSVAVDEVFDASRHVLLPGLVNTHHHFYQTLTRPTRLRSTRNCFPGSLPYTTSGPTWMRLNWRWPANSPWWNC